MAVGSILAGIRIAAGTMVAMVFVFLLNNYLTFWLEWPGLVGLTEDRGWFGGEASGTLDADQIFLGWIQLFLYLGSFVLVVVYVLRSREQPLRVDAGYLAALAAYLVRASFYAVLLVGLVDMLISFLRVEGFLANIIGEHLTGELGRSRFRGAYVHYPLVGISFVIALFTRSLGFVWLALLVVMAEFQIVISRFVFSYEQAFMGDLVRFWYAALFLFASAYTLINEGHVRVDVLYTRFSKKAKAWSNIAGCVLLGIPLCWVILTQGMWGKRDSLNSPLLSFEISQSGFGMYVKYLMAGFLVMFAVSMAVQFTSYILNCVADLCEEPELTTPEGAEAAGTNS